MSIPYCEKCDNDTDLFTDKTDESEDVFCLLCHELVGSFFGDIFKPVINIYKKI